MASIKLRCCTDQFTPDVLCDLVLLSDQPSSTPFTKKFCFVITTNSKPVRLYREIQDGKEEQEPFLTFTNSTRLVSWVFEKAQQKSLINYSKYGSAGDGSFTVCIGKNADLDEVSEFLKTSERPKSDFTPKDNYCEYGSAGQGARTFIFHK